jgi:hypothetical protein
MKIKFMHGAYVYETEAESDDCFMFDDDSWYCMGTAKFANGTFVKFQNSQGNKHKYLPQYLSWAKDLYDK